MYITRRKRVVRVAGDKEIDFGNWDLRDFIMPNCYASRAVFALAWGRLSEFYAKNPEYALKLEKIIGLDNMVIKEMWNTVNKMIRYRYDDPVFQTPDFWLLPDETMHMLHGDCEDTTFLLESAIRGFKRDAKAYACLGFYIDPQTKTPYGHAFILYKADFCHQWLWLETTLETEIPQNIWYPWRKEYLVPVYFFNEKEAYRIDKDYKVLGLDYSYVQQHHNLINEMINYVENGVRTKVKWLHKGKRTPNMGVLKWIYIP